MTMAPAVAVGILGPLIGVVHSSFAHKYGLESLYPNDRDGAVKRRIVMLIWHLPSLTWAALALAILVARLSSSGNMLVTAIAIFIFALSGVGNLWAHRRPFIGGILLIMTAALVVIDWATNS
jgi:hypothetical protein